MSNKRATELQRYVVRQIKRNTEGGRKTTYRYFMTQKHKKIIYIIMVLLIVVWLMQSFGVLPNLGSVRIK